MASAIPSQLVRVAAATTSTTLFTNTNGETTVVSTIAITNTGTLPRTATLTIGGVVLLQDVPVAAKATVVLDNVRQVLTGTQVLAGLATGTDVMFHISGTRLVP